MESGPRTLLHSHHEKNFMEVVDENGYRSLYFSGGIVQSRLRLDRPQQLVLRYTHYMMAASLLIRQDPARVLLIGVGAGALIHFLSHHLPDCRIEAVDYSPHILKIARGYFRLPENERVRIHCLDGLEFLCRNPDAAPFDLILLDAFNEKGMARTIYSAEFFRQARSQLSPTGIICANLWSGNRLLYDGVRKAMRKHSAATVFIPVRKRENVIALLFQEETPWPRICPGRPRLDRLASQFELDFAEVSQAARKENMKLGERLQHLFSA